ncbi:BrnA antitoxin family protein [Chelativorans salis]|uniref:BrnA antitoxin family protein n=1 Tax=Chelativorans salis TaxID=2978478 RepID=A0ABT2LTD8_9HYPH|nr:BrnA antitoxin family protein [Chelativorans sp. EGI FJ00035]MCT7377754.1 BrnA antitoxin family protein [Chelativorans sp. EGI FJ00035]
MKKKIPVFKTDEEVEAFIENADLTEYDLSQFKPLRFVRVDEKAEDGRDEKPTSRPGGSTSAP